MYLGVSEIEEPKSKIQYSMLPDVTCIGVLVADVVGKPIDSLPERGKLQRVERMELHTGGCAANTGISLAKLGVKTAVVGKVGTDGFGDFMVRRLAENGIEYRGVARDTEAATAATMVLVHSDGERSFLHYYGANATLRQPDVDMALVNQSKVVHIAGAFLMPSLDGEPSARILEEAREAGVVTSLDTAWDVTGSWIEKIGVCLPYVDYFLPSFEEARMLANGRDDPEEIARVLLDAGVKVVGLKMGERGAYIRNAAGQEITVPAIQVDAIDALGAGDAFVAGFLTGIVHDWDMERCARFATAVGACCVTALGATTGVRGFDETLAFLEARGRA
jgi:sugar/nucleoside kinase (ribokinase family)